MQFLSGPAVIPSPVLKFLSPVVRLNVTATSQKIFATVSVAFGAGAAGANDLHLYVCYRAVSSTAEPTTVGGGVFDLTATANSRQTETLSASFSVTSVSTYEVGICGESSSAGWTNNEWGYTTGILADS